MSRQGIEAKGLDGGGLGLRRPSMAARCRTLMQFRGLSRRIAATVLLRGAASEELQGIKHVLQVHPVMPCY